jgi:Lsr2
MAQRVEVLLVDDIDGSQAETTIRFGLDGQAYEIDLNAKHATALRGVLGPYADKARRTTANGSKRKGRRAAPAATFRSAAPSGQLDPERRREIRAWAQTSGQFGSVPERGRLSSSIIAAYNAAHGLA